MWRWRSDGPVWLPLLIAGALVAVLSVAGCDLGAAAGARSGNGLPAGPSPTGSRQPAAMAGGACQLLDFDVVAAVLGTEFEVAASGATDGSYTCVLQRSATGLPDLMLSVTPTEADATIFKSTVMPKNGSTVKDLGKAAFSAPVAPSAGVGPGIETGWLSGNGRLIMLRYRTSPGTAAAQVNGMIGKLVELAKKIDTTTG